MKKVFIDGKAGTTGLRIYERLEKRDDIILLSLSEEQRKDIKARTEMLNKADVAFLCLPDEAAREAVSLISNPDTVVIDTSTAHRTLNGWVYGLPELSEEFETAIKTSKRISVPGCHASGFIALVFPLIEAGIVPKSVLLTCFSLTGYSGGGKSMIIEYQNTARDCEYDAPRQYALTQNHKHLPEMRNICRLENNPVFCPVVADFYSGMEVTVPLFASQLLPGKSVSDIRRVYTQKYKGPIINFKSDASHHNFLPANGYVNRDTMEISLHGNDERILLTACYDNLGKGASGAAVECLNIVLGVDKTKGLDL